MRAWGCFFDEGIVAVFVLWLRVIFFFKQKTAYEMRISDWSSDVCSSDLRVRMGIETLFAREHQEIHPERIQRGNEHADQGSVIAEARAPYRSEERRVGKECGRTCRSRWSQYP